MPPRKFNPKSSDRPSTEEEDQHKRKMLINHNEEVAEHEADKDRVKELIEKYEVDLIVVGANKLEAR